MNKDLNKAIASEFSNGVQCDALEFFENVLDNVDVTIKNLFTFKVF
jgi:hypothetical protein